MSDNELGKKRPSKKVGAHSVGFAKPPKGSQFKPGQSGNPSGRPKRSEIPEPGDPGLKKIVQEEAYRIVEINEGGKKKKLPMIQVILMRMCAEAAKGTVSAARLVLEFLRVIENRKEHSHFELFKEVMSYKAKWNQHIIEERKKGVDHPSTPLPHPDDIQLDPWSGTFEFVGPITANEKELWDKWSQMRENAIVDIEDILAKLPEQKTEADQERLEKLQARLEKISNLIGGYDHRERPYIPDPWEN